MISYQQFCESGAWIGHQAMIGGWVDRLQWPSLEIVDDEYLTRFRSTSQCELFNTIFLNRLGDHDLDRNLEQCLSRLSQEATPSRWIISPDTQPSDLAERLAAFGFTRAETLWLMTCELTEQRTQMCAPFAGLNISSVSRDFDLRCCAEIQSHVLGYPSAVSECWQEMLARCGDGSSSWKHYVASVNRRLCASINVLWSDGLVVAENLCVLPEFRGRGIAHSLLTSAFKEAATAGYQVAICYVGQTHLTPCTQLGFERYAPLRRVTIGKRVDQVPATIDITQADNSPTDRPPGRLNGTEA